MLGKKLYSVDSCWILVRVRCKPAYLTNSDTNIAARNASLFELNRILLTLDDIVITR